MSLWTAEPFWPWVLADQVAWTDSLRLEVPVARMRRKAMAGQVTRTPSFRREALAAQMQPWALAARPGQTVVRQLLMPL